MRRYLIVMHIGATLYVVHWTAFLAVGMDLGLATIMIPLQIVSVCCLLGMAYAPGANPSHWTRRYLGWLNIGAAVFTLLWTAAYSEGPLYRAFAARGNRAWGEAIISAFIMGVLVVGISRWLVRQTNADGHTADARNRGILAFSGLVWAAGSIPWLWTMLSTSDPVQRSYSWGSVYVNLMEVTTVIAICVAGFPLLRGYRFAAGLAFTEALAVPLVIRLAGW